MSPRAGTTLGKETNKRSVLQGVGTSGQSGALRSLAGAGKAGRLPGPGGAGPAEETHSFPLWSLIPNQTARARGEASNPAGAQSRQGRVEPGRGGARGSPLSVHSTPASHLDTCTWLPLHDRPSPLQRVLYHVNHTVSLVSSVSLSGSHSSSEEACCLC